jgi:ElaB/YqjD/DUF883 family membrane-anchored ribosome-binding protein
MGIKDWIFPDKRKDMFMHLDPDRIERDEIIKALIQKNNAQEAQLSRIFANEKEKQESGEQESINQETVHRLNEQKKDIDANKYGKVTSLKLFFNRYFKDKQFRDKLELCDKNGETVLGKFGDLVLMEGGKIGILDSENKLVSYGRTLSQVIYKPDGFENQINRNMILIPCDKDGNWIPDIDYIEMEEPIGYEGEYDGQGQIRWGKVKKKELKKLISDKEEQLREVTNNLEREETISQSLKRENDDLKRALEMSKTENYSKQSEVSQITNDFSQVNTKFNELYRRYSNLTELKATYEGLLAEKDAIIEKIKSKLEQTGDTNFEKAKKAVMQDIEFYEEKFKDKSIEISQPPEPKVVPGQVLGQRLGSKPIQQGE